MENWLLQNMEKVNFEPAGFRWGLYNSLFSWLLVAETANLTGMPKAVEGGLINLEDQSPD